ncbi:hypothetical protein AYL99_07431 [Fonsecaea erecta]|uniref:Beta-lactamase-related domain-containing protein n=1 Tax=Fonsecaea erecta TaxID=1367422 RepID=A0A178ZFT5_9EURO|nr:hypothetical protein AYL99_07431 [Fonsecaea erecta]OAP58341.1 hypothetical protein AYL99_07431 [Fonsecaea erecta]
MDPLSVATAASSLVFCVVRSGKALAGIYEKYHDAQRCVFMMQTECTVLAAALSQLQMHFSTVSRSAAGAMDRYPDFVVEAIDLALVGCTLTLSVLSKEIENLTTADSGNNNPLDKAARLARGKKIKYVWKEDTMNELLEQLRGQSAALNLLLRALDSSSIDQILSILRSGQDTFHQVQRGAASIRQTHPQEHYAESILDMKFDDTQTLYSLDNYKALQDDDDQDEIIPSLATMGLGSNRSTPNSQPASTGVRTPGGGPQRHYDAKHDLWYTVDPYTGEARYLPKLSPRNSPAATDPPQPKPAVTRKPVPVTIPAVESRSKQTPTIKNAQPAREPAQPRPSSAPEQPLDFAPWKMNTDAKFRTALENLRKEKSAPAMAVGIVSAMAVGIVSAMAVGIVSANAPPTVQVVGYRRQGSATAVTRADCFVVANSNVFTTTALGVLVERGLFRWDETVLDLFPSLASRVHPFHHQTTLAMLGAHLSGFEAYITGVEEGELFDYIRHGGASVEQQRLAVAMSYLGRPPDRTPGRTGGYSWNWANPILIAAAMEQRTGTRLENLVKWLVFDPLEMYSAGFTDTDNHHSHSNPTQPCGHSADTRLPLDLAQHVFHRGAFSASTGISCSAPDYAAFVGMHLCAAMGLPTAVLLRGIDEGTTLTTPSATTTRSFFHTRLVPEQISTPGGWITATRDWAGAQDAVWLDGRCDGWACTTWIAPATGKAYFALVNVEGDPGVKIADDAVSLVIRHATR